MSKDSRRALNPETNIKRMKNLIMIKREQRQNEKHLLKSGGVNKEQKAKNPINPTLGVQQLLMVLLWPEL